MNKFIQKCVYFIIFCSSMLLLLNYLLLRNSHQNDFGRLQYKEAINKVVNADNIIIGMSHATHGIQPAIINQKGNTFFNFALDGANPNYYFNWYKYIFKPNYKKPTYLIVTLDWFFLDDKWLWRRFEQDSEYFTADLFFNLLYNKNGYNKTMLFENRYPVLKFKKILLPGIFHHDKTTFPISAYNNGFIPYVPKKVKVDEFYPEKVLIYKNQLATFEKLIGQFIADSIRVIFVTTPTYNLDPKPYVNLPIYNYYKSIASKYSIPYLNYNVEKRSIINSSINYYADGGHLNYSGSTVFSTLLKQDLEKIMK